MLIKQTNNYDWKEGEEKRQDENAKEQAKNWVPEQRREEPREPGARLGKVRSGLVRSRQAEEHSRDGRTRQGRRDGGASEQ